MKFEWDQGNRPKCEKRIPIARIERFLASHRYVVFPDPFPLEDRFDAVGHDEDGRGMFIAFMIHDTGVIRVISARYMHKEEIDDY